jgi:hypothetical protein
MSPLKLILSGCHGAVQVLSIYVLLLKPGTLLNGHSKVLPSSVQALQAALKAGVRICLATGKARPAAIAAMQPVGLAGVLKKNPHFLLVPPLHSLKTCLP